MQYIRTRRLCTRTRTPPELCSVSPPGGSVTLLVTLCAAVSDPAWSDSRQPVGPPVSLRSLSVHIWQQALDVRLCSEYVCEA